MQEELERSGYSPGQADIFRKLSAIQGGLESPESLEDELDDEPAEDTAPKVEEEEEGDPLAKC